MKAVEDGEEGLFHDDIASRGHPRRSACDRERVRARSPARTRRCAGAPRPRCATWSNLRVYLDLERGWRVTMPNLEQAGLLRDRLPRAWTASRPATSLWRDTLPRAARRVRRRSASGSAAVLLDEMRRSLAIDAECFDADEFDRIQRRSQEALRPEWAVADADQRRRGDRGPRAGPAGHRPRARCTCPGGASSAATSSARGRFPGYLRR